MLGNFKHRWVIFLIQKEEQSVSVHIQCDNQMTSHDFNQVFNNRG